MYEKENAIVLKSLQARLDNLYRALCDGINFSPYARPVLFAERFIDGVSVLSWMLEPCIFAMICSGYSPDQDEYDKIHNDLTAILNHFGCKKQNAVINALNRNDRVEAIKALLNGDKLSGDDFDAIAKFWLDSKLLMSINWLINNIQICIDKCESNIEACA